MKATFTVFFEAPFWKGIYEREEKKKLSVAIIIFGAEPKDKEVLEFLNTNFIKLSFSKEVAIKQKPIIINYKRLQRKIKKETQPKGIGTKSQQALQQQRALHKIERKEKQKEKKKILEQKHFEQKQQKKKQKRKGH